MTTDLKYLINLPPEKAIQYLKGKGYKLSWDWHEVWQQAHQKSFTVAKAMTEDILKDIKEAVDKAMEEGQTFQEFRKNLEPTLQKQGWWGLHSIVDEAGNVETVQLGSLYRLKTIYRTNIQTSYMAGRYRTHSDNAKNRPYWQYVAVLDQRTRPEHHELHGKVFKHDDPFWDSFYPPNGWGCRCRVRALDRENLQDKGLKTERSKGKLEEEYRLVSKKTGELKPVTVYTNPSSGTKIAPDVGWSYNPGKEIRVN